jgi:hypothetical protein
VPQVISAVRLDGGDQIIVTRDDLLRGFALFQEAGAEVPALLSVPAQPARGERTVDWLREERRRLDLQQLQLSTLRRTLDRRVVRRDAELKQQVYADKTVTNDKLREAAYKLTLTADPEYLDWQSQLDALDDRLAELRVELDALRREFRAAEVEHEAGLLGRRHAA